MGGKTIFEKTYPKEFFDAFMMIWVWKSGFNSWNQNFRKRTLLVWSTVHDLIIAHMISADAHICIQILKWWSNLRTSRLRASRAAG